MFGRLSSFTRTPAAGAPLPGGRKGAGGGLFDTRGAFDADGDGYGRRLRMVGPAAKARVWKQRMEERCRGWFHWDVPCVFFLA